MATPRVGSGASGSSFPLPPELFTQLCAHLSPSDLINATHVSRSWRHTLINTPLLWTDLLGVDLTHARAVDRAESLLGRAHGGLARLEVGLPMNEGWMDDWKENPANVEMMIYRLRRLLRLIQRIDGAHHLTHVSINLESLRDEEDLLFPLLEHAVHFCELVATQITHLSITSHMARFPGGQPWFDILPNIQQLILSTDDDGDDGPDYPDGLQLPPEGEGLDERAPVGLERWVLAGAYLHDTAFQPMPRLTSLKLLNTSVAHLSSLLLACADSLAELWLVGTYPDPFRPPAGAAVTTVALPALKSIYVGCMNAPMFTESQDLERRYVIETPALEDVSWGRKPWFDRVLADEGAEYAPNETFTASVLRTVLEACMSLRRVDVDGTDEEEGALADCWAAAGPNLAEVVLGDRATDAAVGHLARAVPQLRLLSVEHSAVHFTALANVFWTLHTGRDRSLLPTPAAPLTLRVTSHHYSAVRFGTGHLTASLVQALQLAHAVRPAVDPLVDLTAAIRSTFDMRRYGPAQVDWLEVYGEEVAELVAAAEPLETGLAPDARLSASMTESAWGEAERHLREWFTRRIEVGAKAWIEAQDGVVLDWQRGEDGDDADSESGTEMDYE